MYNFLAIKLWFLLYVNMLSGSVWLRQPVEDLRFDLGISFYGFTRCSWTIPNTVYPIQVDIQTIVNTYCLEEGWTVIQSRGQYGNPSDYFFKTSAEYKDGFGKPGNQVCVVVFLCLFFE